jgi:hypothetical protein
MKMEIMNAVKTNSIYNSMSLSTYNKADSEEENSHQFDIAEKYSKLDNILEPWQVLQDLGPTISLFEYELLVETLKDFQKASLESLAHTLVSIANNQSSIDNVNNLPSITLKCNLKGDMTFLNLDGSMEEK